MKQSNTIRNRKEHFIRDLEFNYDELNDLLYVYKNNSNVYSNVMIGDFHLEFNKESELVGIEILNASEILSEFEIPLAILQNIQKVDLKVVTMGNSLLVVLIINSINQTEPAMATITMNNLESPVMAVIASA